MTETKCTCCRLMTKDDELYVDTRSMAYIYGMRDAFILLSKSSTLLPIGFCVIHAQLFNAAMEAVRVAGVAGRQNAESPPLPEGSEGLSSG